MISTSSVLFLYQCRYPLHFLRRGPHCPYRDSLQYLDPHLPIHEQYRYIRHCLCQYVKLHLEQDSVLLLQWFGQFLLEHLVRPRSCQKFLFENIMESITQLTSTPHGSGGLLKSIRYFMLRNHCGICGIVTHFGDIINH
jgi:hypothetical protein